MLGILASTASANQPTYGVVPQDAVLPSADDIDLMAAGGVDSIRLLLHWPRVESTRGTYDWSGIDEIVRETSNRGVKPFFFIYGIPPWAAKLDGRKHCRRRDCSIYPPNSDKTRQAFAAFAKAAVKRYGPGGDFWETPTARALRRLESADVDELAQRFPCTPAPFPGCMPTPASAVPPLGEAPCGCTEAHPLRTWQIWNEQNSPKYYAPKVDIAGYAKLVKSAGNAIKTADPGADVILGGTWGPATAKSVLPIEPYLTALYRVKGIEKSFDSIALHPYAPNPGDSLAQLEAARTASRRAGDRQVGIWVTELGWASDGPATNLYVKGLQGQAQLLSKTLARLEQKQRRFNLRGVFWYSWRDKAGGDLICEWCGYAGLRALDGSAKPAWDAFTRVASN